MKHILNNEDLSLWRKESLTYMLMLLSNQESNVLLCSLPLWEQQGVERWAVKILLWSWKYCLHIFRESRLKITPLQYYFGGINSLLLMRFSLISIRMVFKKHHPHTKIKQWNINIFSSRNQVSIHAGQIQRTDLLCRGAGVISFRSSFSCSASCFRSTMHF